MRWHGWSLMALCCMFVLLGGPASAWAKQPKRPPAGPLITFYAPHPQQVELALDEMELDWSGDPGAKVQAPARTAATTADTRVVASDAVRARVAVSGVSGPADLLAKAAALKAANPGAEAHLVVYDPGLPKSEATRQLLTREVGILLQAGNDVGPVVAGLPAGALRPVPGVPDGYVVEAADPLAAVDLANAIRVRPGVQSAYPLLRRLYFPR